MVALIGALFTMGSAVRVFYPAMAGGLMLLIWASYTPPLCSVWPSALSSAGVWRIYRTQTG